MSEANPNVSVCAGCSLQLAPTMLACPSCQRLVHKERLEVLANQATTAAASGDITASLQSWREALELVPRNSKQFAIISKKVTELGLKLPNSQTPPGSLWTRNTAKGSNATAAGVATGLGAIGLLAWKFKVLLVGLTKGSTFFSMLASLGVYWTIWGWQFALGLVLSIYVHEMGHMIQLRRYGFRTGAPMFIPGLGALIRMQQNVVNGRENADIGLAGPIYGLGAALVSLALWQVTSLPLFAAIAGVGAWINLFNLLPFGSLDGGRAFQAMSRYEKIACTLCVGIAMFFARDGLLGLVLIGCVVQIFASKSDPVGYRKAAIVYGLLVFTLTGLSLVKNHVDQEVKEGKRQDVQEVDEPIQ